MKALTAAAIVLGLISLACFTLTWLAHRNDTLPPEDM